MSPSTPTFKYEKGILLNLRQSTVKEPQFSNTDDVNLKRIFTHHKPLFNDQHVFVIHSVSNLKRKMKEKGMLALDEYCENPAPKFNKMESDVRALMQSTIFKDIASFSCKYSILLQESMGPGLGTPFQDIFTAYNIAIVRLNAGLTHSIQERALDIILFVFSELREKELSKLWRLCSLCGALLRELFHRTCATGEATGRDPLINGLLRLVLVLTSELTCAHPHEVSCFIDSFARLISPFLNDSLCKYPSFFKEISWRCRMLALSQPYLSMEQRKDMIDVSHLCIKIKQETGKHKNVKNLKEENVAGSQKQRTKQNKSPRGEMNAQQKHTPTKAIHSTDLVSHFAAATISSRNKQREKEPESPRNNAPPRAFGSPLASKNHRT